jgi:hypothetical protein
MVSEIHEEMAEMAEMLHDMEDIIETCKQVPEEEEAALKRW